MKIQKKQAQDNPAQYFFMCPGCGFVHSFGEKWKFNKDYEKPTVSPSILVTRGGGNYRCHSFITDGRIRFLSDCSHRLAGQIVSLPDCNID